MLLREQRLLLLPRLRCARWIIAAAPLPSAVEKQLPRRAGDVLLEVDGLSEVGVAALPPDDVMSEGNLSKPKDLLRGVAPEIVRSILRKHSSAGGFHQAGAGDHVHLSLIHI